ncbi:MFS transporter [Streptomyces sp. NPDC001393]
MQLWAAVSGGFGSTLEFFDFAIYGALSASLFPKLFFSGLGNSGALLASFATFGVGFVARPAGAILFGHLGDRFGRRPMLYITLAMMGTASIIIGLLPTGKGVAVASILVALRFVQGFSLGGEHTGNELMVIEHANRNRRGVMSSFVAIGSPISQVAANLLLAVLTTELSEQQWSSWGWRIPFLSSLAIVAVAAYIRTKLAETPAFVAKEDKDETEHASAKPHGMGIRVLLTQPREIIQLALFWGGPTLSFYLIVVYGLTLLTRQGGIASNDTFAILVIANAISVPACIVGGMVSDRIGRKRAIFFGLIGCTVGVTMFFVFALSGSLLPITVAITLALSSIQFLAGGQPALFAETFPTQSRFSGSALAFTLANLVFAAPAPLIATALVDAGGTQSLMWLALAVNVVSVIAVVTVTDRTGVNLATLTDEHETPVTISARNPQDTQA